MKANITPEVVKFAADITRNIAGKRTNYVLSNDNNEAFYVIKRIEDILYVKKVDGPITNKNCQYKFWTARTEKISEEEFAEKVVRYNGNNGFSVAIGDNDGMTVFTYMNDYINNKNYVSKGA